MRLLSRGRLAALAALTAVLTVAGGGGAVALWSASAQLAVAGGAATTGIAQTVHPTAATTPLAVEYGAGSLTAAGAVTIANTGSRPAVYSLSLIAASATAAGLPGAIAVAVAPVASAAACTVGAALVAPATGSLSTTAAVTATGSLPAGQSVVLCVQTTLPAAQLAAFGGQSLVVSGGSSLVYAPGAAWTASAAPFAFTQSVGQVAAPLFFTSPVGRYYVYSSHWSSSAQQLVGAGQICTAGGTVYPARYAPSCSGDDWIKQWRIQRVPGSASKFHIVEARNGYNQPNTPRWTYMGTSTAIQKSAPSASPDQEWTIQLRADGHSYRIVAANATGPGGGPLCVSIGGPVWSPPTPELLVMTSCDDALASQGFSFELKPTPLPPADGFPGGYPIGCTGSDSWRTLSWPRSVNYEQEVNYRVLWNGQQAQLLTDGYNPYVAFGPSTAWLEAYWAAHGGGQSSFTVTMEVEQQITSLGDWIDITQSRTLVFQHLGTNDNRVSCP